MQRPGNGGATRQHPDAAAAIRQIGADQALVELAQPQSVVFPAAFAFFHLALAAAEMAARAAADILRLGFAVFPFTFAHRAFCAAAILALAAADIFRLPARSFWILPPKI
jgi:hypothetical protein